MRKRLSVLCGLLVAVFTSLQAQIFEEREQSNGVISDFRQFEPGREPNLADWQELLRKSAAAGEQSSWKIYTVINDDLGQVHYRAQQYFGGIPLENGVVVLHTKEGRILSFNGELIPESLIKGSVSIGPEAARKMAMAAVPADLYYWEDESQNHLLREQTGVADTSWFPEGTLVYCPQGLDYRNPHRLAYRFEVMALEPLAGKKVYVDAGTGEILATEDLILHTDVKGTGVTAYSGTRVMTTDSTTPGNYRLREKSRGKGIETFNMQKGTSYGAAVDFTDADNYWNNVNANKDEVATDAHWGAEKTYDYFDTILGRNSFDGSGAKIISYVHYSNNYANAFWNGAYMTYGDGNGTSWKPLTSIDVCGHEISHAVTTYTAGLIYSYESGALNESFSDIFGNAIERWARPNKYNWKMGEDFTVSGAGIRDMSNPNPYNNPKYYKGNKWYTGAGDNGGVHYNSGVQNYWFYLITDGIAGTNEKGDVFDIDSLGLIDASRIAYRNLSVYLTKNSQYADARKYSIMAAADLFGNCSKHVIAVTNAWWACGVGAKYDSGYVKASFLADTLVCSTAKPVKFTNTSENALSAKWTFGDGNQSTVYSPVHFYSSYGVFTVKLVAGSCFQNKSDSITRVAYIKVDSTYDICRGVLMPASGTDSVIQCKGFIYDDGGEGFYGALRQTNLKVKVPGATSIRFRFLVLDYENGYDSIVLFKTNTANANKIGRFTGNAIPFGGTWQTVTADALWLRHYSDPLVEGAGFKIEFEGIRTPLTLELGNDTTICMGDSLVLAPVAGGGYAPDYRFVWNTGFTGNPFVVKPVVQTQYHVTLRDACTFLTLEDSIMVDVRPALQVSLGNDTVICSGNSVSLLAKVSGGLSSAYTYSWNNGLGNAPTHTVTPSVTTTYRVILNDGCTEKPDTAYRTVYVKPPLNVSISATDTLVCIGKSVGLTATASGGDTLGYAFSWNQGLGNGSSKTITLTDTGTYTVTLTDGCSVTPAVSSITLYTYPRLNLAMTGDTLICRGTGVDLMASGSGGKGTGYSYTWSHGKTAASITEFPASARYYKVTFSDGCSPSISDSVYIDLMAPLALSRVRDTILCNGQSLPLTLIATGGITTSHAITWTPSGTVGFSVNLSPSTGTTTYRAILSDGCTVKNDTTSFKITKLAPLTANIVINPAAVCPGDSVGMQFTFSGGKPANYLWTLDGIPVTFRKQTILPVLSKTYTLNLNDGCSLPAFASDDVVVHPAAFATLSVNPKVVCDGTPVVFSYTSPDAALVKWYFSSGDSMNGTGLNLPVVFAPGAYTASAKVVTGQGCTGKFDLTDTIKIVAFPKAIFNPVPDVTDIENPKVVFNDGSTGADNWIWSFGDGLYSNLSGTQSHTYLDTGWYRAELIVSVFPGCRDSASHWIRVKDVYRLHMPNTFTPDGNNLNDVYVPKGRGIKTFQMKIYNRWGMKVFESFDMKNGWDGRKKDGELWEPGIYPVLIEVIDTEGFRHVEKGTILLMR